MESPFLQTEGWLRWLGLFLGGVCHQFPDHSLFVAGVQLPLCARCTGTYLGALLGIVSMFCWGRARASHLPPVRVLLVMGAFFAFWVVDGVNSYVQFVGERIWLYPPSNLLRLASGTGNGVALCLLVVPMFNSSLWQRPDERPILRGLADLALLALVATVLVLLLLWGAPALLYPLLLLQVLSVLIMLSAVNAIIFILVLGRQNQAHAWGDALQPLAVGLLLSVCEVGSLALGRSLLLRTILLAPGL